MINNLDYTENMPIIFGNKTTYIKNLDRNELYIIYLYNKGTKKFLTKLENLTLQDLMTEIITISKSKDIADYNADFQKSKSKNL